MSSGKKTHAGTAKCLSGGKYAWMVKEEFQWKDRLEKMKGKISSDIRVMHTLHW